MRAKAASLPPRWMYRFDNYRRAFGLLEEAMQVMKERELSALEKEGVIQRFEYTWELAWKLMKDYLEHNGIVLETITPASVIRAAFAARIIEQGDRWMQALDARNRMSHTYDLKVFEEVINLIRGEYLALLQSLYLFMEKKAQEAGSNG